MLDSMKDIIQHNVALQKIARCDMACKVVGVNDVNCSVHGTVNISVVYASVNIKSAESLLNVSRSQPFGRARRPTLDAERRLAYIGHGR